MKVTIRCRINVAGTSWEVDVERDITEAAKSAGKTEAIKAIIRGMSKAGLTSAVAAPTSGAGEPPPQKSTGNHGGGCEMEGADWPVPHCKVHREALVPSKVQKTTGYTAYYCPKRLEEGYCLQRAIVANNGGKPKFWEVSK